MQDISKNVITRAAGGNMDAFEHIYRTASGFVYNVALRVTNNRPSAEEVAQDVFLKIYRNLKNFEFKSSFKTWIYRIAVNTAINASKKTSRETDRRVEYDDEAKQKTSIEIAQSASGELDNKELVKRLLAMLNPDQRACIVLRSIEGLSYKEIADALHININTVRTRLMRARETLSRNLKEKR